MSKKTTGLTSSIKTMEDTDRDYHNFLGEVRKYFSRVSKNVKLFKVDLRANLFDEYLKILPAEVRQQHTCSACSYFLRHYGDLVYITEDGLLKSAVWNIDTTEVGMYGRVAARMMALVESTTNRVSDYFLSWDAIYGVPSNRGPGAGGTTYYHLSVTPASANLYRDHLKSAGQRMAEYRHEHQTLSHALSVFEVKHLKTALEMARTKMIHRSEVVQPLLEWLLDLKTRLSAKGMTPARYHNLVWAAVASAPAGFTTPRSSVAGSLLEDIAAGMDNKETIQRFNEKVDPSVYRRPTLPPKEGNVVAAEKAIEKLGYKLSLVRRVATLDDVQKVWVKAQSKKPIAKSSTGLFAHVETRSDAVSDGDSAPIPTPSYNYLPRREVTWRVFERDILPNVKSIKYPTRRINELFTGFLMAQHPEAPCIFNYGDPVSWYLHLGGSSPQQWNLEYGTTYDVKAIITLPCLWGKSPRDTFTGAVFIIEEAWDTKLHKIGSSLFPEILVNELHPYRATIEGYSRSTAVIGHEGPHLGGIQVGRSDKDDAATPFIVTLKNGSSMVVVIDRWE